MFEWLFNLFKKKEKRLVAMITGSFSYKIPYSYQSQKGRITYSLYEREDGKRKVKYTLDYQGSNTNAYEQSYHKTRLSDLIDGWECGGLMTSKIPSFRACTDLVRPVILEIVDDRNLNDLY